MPDRSILFASILFASTLLLALPRTAGAQACRHQCLAGETRDGRGCCVAARAVGGRAPRCYRGQTMVAGRCRGIPDECPRGMAVAAQAETCVLEPCPDGMVRMPDRTSCCWPGQVVDRQGDREPGRWICRGVPRRCPQGRVVVGEACDPVQLAPQLSPACGPGQARTASTAGRCCWRGQRFEAGACRGAPGACPQTYALRATGGEDCEEIFALMVREGDACCCRVGQRLVWATYPTYRAFHCEGRPPACELGMMPTESGCTAVECAAGQVRVNDPDGRPTGFCCWPGQTLDHANRCHGTPATCPAGTTARGEDCVNSTP